MDAIPITNNENKIPVVPFPKSDPINETPKNDNIIFKT